MDQMRPWAQERDGIWASHPSAAGRQDGRVCGCELSRQLVLQIPKGWLAVCTNNSRDRASGAALQLGVEVQEREAQSLGE